MIAKQCVPPFYSKFQLPSKHIKYTIKGGMITKKNTFCLKVAILSLPTKIRNKTFFLEKHNIFYTL